MRWSALRLLIGAAVLVGATTAGCTTRKTSDRSLVFVEVAEAETLVRGRSSLLGLGGRGAGAWVDPRSARKYQAGHIPGAIHLPFEDARERHQQLDGYATIIVYGDEYNSPIAHAMSKSLIELGHDDVRTLRGGLRAWEDAGNPVER